jgi:hypothetical protein
MNVVQQGDMDVLYDMRRCNRSPGRSVEKILREIE